MYKRNIKSRQ